VGLQYSLLPCRDFNIVCFLDSKFKYSDCRRCGRGLHAQARPVIGCRKCGCGTTHSISPLIGHMGALLTAPTCVCGRMTHITRLTPGFQHYVSGVPEPFCRCAIVKFRCYQKIPAVNSVPFVPSTAKICRFCSSVEIGSIPIFSVGP